MKILTSIESATDLETKINYISRQLAEIVSNTTTFEGWDNCLMAIASLGGTILTFIIFSQLRERGITRDTQKTIMLDLMRHLMVNAATLETIITNIGSTKPIEGTLERFATLDNDLELGKFMLKAHYYHELHNTCLKIRNYNSMAVLTDKHMHTPGYPTSTLKDELRSLLSRGTDISDRLLELSEKLHKSESINMDIFAEYVTHRYRTALGPSRLSSVLCPCYNTKSLGATYEFLIDRQSRSIITL